MAKFLTSLALGCIKIFMNVFRVQVYDDVSIHNEFAVRIFGQFNYKISIGLLVNDEDIIMTDVGGIIVL